MCFGSVCHGRAWTRVGRMIWEGPDDQGDSPAQKHQLDNKLMENGIDILLFCMGCTFTLAASAAF
jgi:hypothetical protein